MSGGVTEKLAAELAAYKTSKGTIQFASDKAFPVALLKKILATRRAEIEGEAGGKPRRAKPAPARK